MSIAETSYREADLREVLTKARRAMVRAKSAGEREAATREYRLALNERIEHIARTRGIAAAESFRFGETWLFGKICREQHQTTIKLLGAAALVVAVGAAWSVGMVGIEQVAPAVITYLKSAAPSILYGMLWGIPAGLLVREMSGLVYVRMAAHKEGLSPKELTSAHYQDAVRTATDHLKKGGSYEDFQKTKGAAIIRAMTRIGIYKTRTGIAAGIGTGFAAVETTGDTIGRNLIGLVTGDSHVMDTLLVSQAEVGTMRHTFAQVAERAQEFVGFMFGTQVHAAVSEQVKPISKLGGDPYIPGETLAERTEYFAQNYEKIVARAADELAREGNWSVGRKAAFTKALLENRQTILDMFSGKVPAGTIKSGSLIPGMMNGEHPSGGVNEARGPYKYTGPDTPAVLFEYSADGKTYLAGIPTDCGNFSDLGVVTPDAPVEVPPVAPEECTDEWKKRYGFEHPQSTGIGVENVKRPLIPVVPGESEAAALERIVTDAKDGVLSNGMPVKEGMTYIMMVDSDCDGHPEKIYCVCFEKNDNGEWVIKSKEDFEGNTSSNAGNSKFDKNYNKMSPEQQRNFIKRHTTLMSVT